MRKKDGPIEKVIIGRNERVSLPELNFFNIDAKIDTGARGNSIHCDDIYLKDEHTVHFKLLDDNHPDYCEQHIEMPVYKIKKVKSSNGEVEERIVVKTEIELLGQVYETELSLTNRKKMTYPMLIGRRYLQGRFIVDVSMEYQEINEEDE